MIIEITSNKYVKLKQPINEDILMMYRNWFLTNQDQWFFGWQLEQYIGKTCPRKYINILRCEGMPIISNTSKGYKYTTNKNEMKQCYEDLRNRALRALTACRIMKKQII